MFFVIALISGPAWAEDCPEPLDYSTELDALIASARAASSAIGAKDVTSGMWDVWLRAPNDQAQEVLDRGLARRNGYDFVGAYRDFDKLVEYDFEANTDTNSNTNQKQFFPITDTFLIHHINIIIDTMII